MSNHSTKSVFQDENGEWFFWDETWTDAIGPYTSELKAAREQINYCLEALGNYPPEQEQRLKDKLVEYDKLLCEQEVV